MAEHGATVVQDTGLIVPWEHFKHGGKSFIHDVSFFQISHGNMQGFIDGFEDFDIRSVVEMIKYSEAHADVCLPLGKTSVQRRTVAVAFF